MSVVQQIEQNWVFFSMQLKKRIRRLSNADERAGDRSLCNFIIDPEWDINRLMYEFAMFLYPHSSSIQGLTNGLYRKRSSRYHKDEFCLTVSSLLLVASILA